MDQDFISNDVHGGESLSGLTNTANRGVSSLITFTLASKLEGRSRGLLGIGIAVVVLRAVFFGHVH